MAKYQSEIQLLLRARDEASGPLRALGDNVSSINQKMAQAQSALQLAAGLNALSGAATIATASIKALQGDLEGAEQAIYRLPLGLGRVIQDFTELGRTIRLAWDKDAARMIDGLERMTLQMDALGDAARGAIPIIGRLNSMTGDMAGRVSILLADDDFERERIRIRQQYEQTIATIKEMEDRAEFENEQGRVDAAREARRARSEAAQLMQTEMQVIRQRELEAQDEHARQSAERVLRADEEARSARLDAMRELADVEAETRQMMLQSLGQDLEAELLAIERNYTRRINMARDAGREEVAIQLEVQKQIAEARARDRAEQQSERGMAGRSYDSGLQASRFLTGVQSQQSAEKRMQQEILRVQRQQAQEQKQTNEHLHQLVQSTKSGGFSFEWMDL